MPRPRVPTAGNLVWQLALKWRVAVDRALAPLGMTHAHYALLASLYGLSKSGDRPSQRELADYAGLEPMYVSKLVRGLERSSLLRRSDHPDDPRAFQLELTAKGSDLIVHAATIVSALYDRLLLPVGGRAAKANTTFLRTLESLLDHAELVTQHGAITLSPGKQRARKVRSARGGNRVT